LVARTEELRKAVEEARLAQDAAKPAEEQRVAGNRPLADQGANTPQNRRAQFDQGGSDRRAALQQWHAVLF
jgi:hypothetical protein